MKFEKSPQTNELKTVFYQKKKILLKWFYKSDE